MERITFSAEAQHVETVEAVEDRDDVDSRSAAMRTIIDDYAEMRRRVSELQNEVEDLEQEVERVRREKRQVLEQREEHDELVRVVERERSLQERRAQAGIVTRVKWWATGMPDDD